MLSNVKALFDHVMCWHKKIFTNLQEQARQESKEQEEEVELPKLDLFGSYYKQSQPTDDPLPAAMQFGWHQNQYLFKDSSAI